MRRTCGSSTRRPALRNYTCEFARVASDNIATCRTCLPRFDNGHRHQLQGIELRYALTLYLLQHGPTTVDELIKAMKWQGFDIGGRASKQVSDALRWERRRGRVRRIARGIYGPGYVPRATEYRIHQRVLALRAAAKPLWLGGTQL